MKIFRTLGFLALLIGALGASAQTDKATTARLLAEKNFTFVATAAIPSSSAEVSRVMSGMSGGNANGGMINLSGGGYDVRVQRDTLVSFLPYYGRAYSGNLNTNDGGFKFTATRYTYKSTPRKKGGWEVYLATTEHGDNIRMNLSVSENGYATLSLTSSNRQPIIYNGYLKESRR